MTTTPDETRTAAHLQAERLRAVAGLIEGRPDLPPAFVIGFASGRVEVTWHLHGAGRLPREQEALARQIRYSLAADWTQRPWTLRPTWEATLPAGIELVITFDTEDAS